jgi:hypothetical protein
MCSASAPCVFVYHANPLPTAPLPTCRSKPPTSLPTPLNISSTYTHAVQTPFYLLHQLGSDIGAEMRTRHPSSSSNPATSAVGVPDQATSTAHFGTSVDVSYNICRLFGICFASFNFVVAPLTRFTAASYVDAITIMITDRI